MDIKHIEKLIVLLKKHGLQSLEVEDKDVGKVKLSAASGPSGHWTPSPMVGMAAPVNTTQPVDLSGDRSKQIRSPFVGTYYEAATPGAEAFVRPGSQVKKGDTLCIIEAMKIMNEIEADRDGTIKEVLVKNGQPLEFDQIIFTIE